MSKNWFITFAFVGGMLSLLPWIGDNSFMRWGREGLINEQRMEMLQKQFDNERQLRELEERNRQAEHDRQLQLLDRKNTDLAFTTSSHARGRLLTSVSR